MVICNGLVFTSEFRFEKLDLQIQDGRIIQLAPPGSLKDDMLYDANGKYLIPGFVDIHTHGAAGFDFSDGHPDGIPEMLRFYASRGVTAIVPATMSCSRTVLKEALKSMVPFFEREGFGAVLWGVNMEGPFLNPRRKGAQNEAHLINPDIEMFREFWGLTNGRIRIVDMAPELPEGLEFIRRISGICTVSLAHTDATYEQACQAFDAGATHVTHLFNGMPPYNHRDPGVVGATYDRAMTAEIICDGFHIHPSVVRSAFRDLGPDKICLVSDSMRACGMPGGVYTLGGVEVAVSGNKATTASGSLAGSVADLAECCRRLIAFKVPIEHALRAATANPAKVVGLQGEIGLIAPGMRADLVIWNEDFRTDGVWVGGKAVRFSQVTRGVGQLPDHPENPHSKRLGQRL